MNKEQFVALGLSDEQAEKAAVASAEELKGFIPKARFDEVNTAKKKAEDDLKDRDKQLEDLKKTNGDAAELTKKIETLQAENKAAKEKYEAEAKDMRLNTAIDKALATANAKHSDLLLGKIDKTKLELQEDGTVKGLEDQVKTLKTSYKELFVEESAGQFQFRGANLFESGGSSGGGGGKDKAADFGKKIADFAKANSATSDAQKSYFGG
ncbi:phage scaffolding protein [Cohnella boryungensis]|uniref:Phage scaffolding protein n=1 Tax=Cohnella boryungensis TaxID=768479 RepID=A0ABV8SHA8_9BACL